MWYFHLGFQGFCCRDFLFSLGKYSHHFQQHHHVLGPSVKWIFCTVLLALGTLGELHSRMLQLHLGSYPLSTTVLWQLALGLFLASSLNPCFLCLQSSSLVSLPPLSTFMDHSGLTINQATYALCSTNSCSISDSQSVAGGRTELTHLRALNLQVNVDVLAVTSSLEELGLSEEGFL